jgi:acyl-CoA thioesterase-1
MRNLFFLTSFLAFLILVSCGEMKPKEKENLVQEDSLIVIEKTPVAEKKVILFFGTSLTAGMGLDLQEAFPAIIQQKIDSLGLDFTVVNAGLSGDTSASGKNRIEWVLNQEVAVFVLELGANDGLRGLPLKETAANLQAIIDIVRKKNADTKIVIAGMQMPPNMGSEYTTEFKEMFPKLAKENKVALVPFLLENVGGYPALNQDDGIHPTAEGQKIVAANVWKVLQPMLLDQKVVRNDGN